MLNIASDLGSPRADQVSIATFSNYRAERLDAGLKIGSINRRHMAYDAERRVYQADKAGAISYPPPAERPGTAERQHPRNDLAGQAQNRHFSATPDRRQAEGGQTLHSHRRGGVKRPTLRTMP